MNSVWGDGRIKLWCAGNTSDWNALYILCTIIILLRMLSIYVYIQYI